MAVNADDVLEASLRAIPGEGPVDRTVRARQFWTWGFAEVSPGERFSG
jgi:hypothetical protein